MTDLLAVQDGPALRITFNRPEHGNTASDSMVGELMQLLQTAEERARFVVLRGAGDHFCAGRATFASSRRRHRIGCAHARLLPVMKTRSA